MIKRNTSRGAEHCSDASGVVQSQKVLKFVQQKSRMVRALRPCTRGHDWKSWSPQENHKDFYAILPPIDSFMGVDKRDSLDHMWNGFEHGDLVIVRISSIRESGMSALLLALDGGKSRDVSCHKIYAWCHVSEIPKETNHEDVLLRFSDGDIVRCVILDVNARDEEIIVSLRDQAGLHVGAPLGKIEDEDLPLAYRRHISANEPYETVLTKSISFVNPNNVEYLMSRLKVPAENIVSLMDSLHNKRFPKEECAEFIRKRQSKKVADRSVKKGIEKFKNSEYIVALQDFNYALDMDTENVDALVARGALYANRGTFSKAIHDFEGALKLEPAHRNAKKYLVQVLIERAQQIESQMEDVQQVKEVERCYNQALRLDPSCNEAIKALGKIEQDRIKTKENSASRSSDSSQEDNKYAATAEKLRQILKGETNLKEQKLSETSAKRKMSQNGSRKERSSSSSTSSSSSGSSSSSPSSSSSSSTENEGSRRRKRKSSSSSSSTEGEGSRRRKRQSTSSSSSSSSTEDEGNRTKRKSTSSTGSNKRKRNMTESRGPLISTSNQGNSRKASSSRSTSPRKRKSWDRQRDRELHSARSKSPLSRTSQDRKRSRESPSRRRKSVSSTGASDRKMIEKRRRSDIPYRAIIHSKSSHHNDSARDSHEPLPNKTRRDAAKTDYDRQSSAQITNITKDNFHDILKEISKFESSTKSSH